MTFTLGRTRPAAALASATRFSRARAALATLAVAGTLLGGCSSSDKSTGPGNVVGTYNIVSTSGPQGTDNSSPFVLLNQNIGGSVYRLQITSGSITLGADKRYSGTGVLDLYIDDVLQPDDGTDSFPSGGTYTVSGSTVTFTPDDGSGDVTATFSGGNTLTFSETQAGIGTLKIVARK